MKQKVIGISLICIGIIIALLLVFAKAKEDYYIDQLIVANTTGTCVLPDGYCLHEDRNWSFYIAGSILSSALILLGLYLLFFDKTYELLSQQQKEFTKEVKESKKKSEFEAFLSGFTDEEQLVLKAIHEQEGIKQDTLRFKTGISKSSLSLLLSSLEKREFITRKPAGKTNQIFLRKKF